MEEKLNQLSVLNETAQNEGAKFAAGTRLRKALQEIVVLSKEMRKEVSEIKNK